MRALRKNKLTHLKRFIFGGEGYPKAKLKELYDLYGDRITFYNVYGPTECACMCSAYIISKNDLKDLYGFAPLGQIALNFDYLILDGNEKIVSEGEVGELCLLGPNVGLGYYNDPERTSMSFVQNPSNKIYKEIMYKTGDLVLYNPYDNNIYIKGRKDYQIKHMGYRIELEEIENALNQLDYVDQAAAIHVVRNNLSKIFGIVQLNAKIEETKLREDLENIIPSYMIPTNFYFEKILPKNANGKLDRKTLQLKYGAV